jgi:hypothetical protein
MTYDRFVFGVTIDQIDELSSLLRTITAHGDALTFCDTGYLQPRSVSTLEEAILDSALPVRDILQNGVGFTYRGLVREYAPVR